ncbi:nuclear transport factor 2 family protein [Rouxiella sp. Mn2063]|uniref:nuclear transport factor 2 family protein n=1 Tax=Rouxiella sp. Mn2063 TaxID=3395262 RepID=UPI003BDF68B2
MSLNEDLFPQLTSLLRQTLSSLLDPNAKLLLDMMAENVVFEFPYALPDGVQAVNGKQALADYLLSVSGLISLDSMTLQRCVLALEGNTAVLEFSGTGRLNKTGQPYHQRYISVIEIKERLIVRYSDYWNPLALQSTHQQEGESHAE